MKLFDINQHKNPKLIKTLKITNDTVKLISCYWKCSIIIHNLIDNVVLNHLKDAHQKDINCLKLNKTCNRLLSWRR